MRFNVCGFWPTHTAGGGIFQVEVKSFASLLVFKGKDRHFLHTPEVYEEYKKLCSSVDIAGWQSPRQWWMEPMSKKKCGLILCVCVCHFLLPLSFSLSFSFDLHPRNHTLASPSKEMQQVSYGTGAYSVPAVAPCLASALHKGKEASLPPCHQGNAVGHVLTAQEGSRDKEERQ